ncbi:hypothetical protein BK660_19750 [Pseudomonas brassicacearum]|uniref:Uncharacterized protein n=1 Tax=Pseudomonas brassicacearum TaxID=930166 RepID=A0A423I0Y2_9PSED|nr:hypothetical protein BK660_19750 [Pseudomonas brassicacearum]
MRRPALALAWLSKWLLLKQTSLPEPGWLAWRLARRSAWRQQVFLLLVWQQAWPPVLQQAWPRQAWLQVWLRQVLLRWPWPVWQRRQVLQQQVLLPV